MKNFVFSAAILFASTSSFAKILPTTAQFQEIPVGAQVYFTTPLKTGSYSIDSGNWRGFPKQNCNVTGNSISATSVLLIQSASQTQLELVGVSAEGNNIHTLIRCELGTINNFNAMTRTTAKFLTPDHFDYSFYTQSVTEAKTKRMLAKQSTSKKRQDDPSLQIPAIQKDLQLLEEMNQKIKTYVKEYRASYRALDVLGVNVALLKIEKLTSATENLRANLRKRGVPTLSEQQRPQLQSLPSYLKN